MGCGNIRLPRVEEGTIDAFVSRVRLAGGSEGRRNLLNEIEARAQEQNRELYEFVTAHAFALTSTIANGANGDSRRFYIQCGDGIWMNAMYIYQILMIQAEKDRTELPCATAETLAEIEKESYLEGRVFRLHRQMPEEAAHAMANMHRENIELARHLERVWDIGENYLGLDRKSVV